MMSSIILVVLGLTALAVGGELLVRGAVGIAQKLGVSTMFTGLVIVGAATSMPELVASVQAVLSGAPEIAWGNIVGSNIANSLLILGAAALIYPIALGGKSKRDSVVAMLATLGVFGLALFSLASQYIGAGLLALLIMYIIWRYRHPPATDPEEDLPEKVPNFLISLVLFLVGIGALVLGGDWLVDGAIVIASEMGVSETAIGLTVVAIGTSLPELAASAAAAFRKHADLAIGNVVGSNIYNLLLIGGSTMLLSPTAIPGDLMPIGWGICLASALMIMLLVRYVDTIGRVLGLLMLAAFAANTALAFA